MVQAKYRGYDTDSKVWRYGYYFCMEDITLAAIYNSEEQWQKDKKANKHHLILWNGFSDWCMPKPHYQSEVDSDSIGQSTGKFDKNGKEIFSGDIVRAFRKKRTKIDGTVIENFYEYAIIQWNDSIVGFQKNPVDDWVFTTWDEIEVVGNTYENYILNGEVLNKNSVTE